MAIRDLKAYSQALGGSISYYHDRYDLEADAVLHLEDGRYALIEFKLGSREIDGATDNKIHSGKGAILIPIVLNFAVDQRSQLYDYRIS